MSEVVCTSELGFRRCAQTSPDIWPVHAPVHDGMIYGMGGGAGGAPRPRRMAGSRPTSMVRHTPPAGTATPSAERPQN